jgi:hypothetical protein
MDSELPLPAYTDHPQPSSGAFAAGGDRWKFWTQPKQDLPYRPELPAAQQTQEMDAMPRAHELQ